jgi:hypothetical protein
MTAVRAAAGIAAAAILAITLAESANAHALMRRYDLPLPLAFFLIAAGAAVAVTFAVLALATQRLKGIETDEAPERVLARGTLPASAAIAARALSAALLLLVVAAGLFGHQNPFKNLAPVSIWVIWWVGFGLVSAFVGNLWPILNPFAALFDFAEWLASSRSGRLAPRWHYPARLGAWPACLLLLVFAWLELVVPGRDVPRHIAIGIIVYAGMTFAGFFAFGRGAWLKGGEVFSVLFDLFGRFAPLHLRRDQSWHWSLRPYASGLHTHRPLDTSMIAFTLLALGTVTVDGLLETPLWASFVDRVLATQPLNPQSYVLLATALLVAGPLLLAALYLAAIAMMSEIAGGPGLKPLAGMFVLSLVPIAIAYHVAHYFSLLAIAGQFIIPLASDPFGYGWDLFGTTLYRVDIGIVDARFVWYLAVIAIVTGHMIAIWLAHVAAAQVYADARAARRSQYPMLILMVGYTMLSLWILAQPIVEAGVAKGS